MKRFDGSLSELCRVKVFCAVTATGFGACVCEGGRGNDVAACLCGLAVKAAIAMAATRRIETKAMILGLVSQPAVSLRPELSSNCGVLTKLLRQP